MTRRAADDRLFLTEGADRHEGGRQLARLVRRQHMSWKNQAFPGRTLSSANGAIGLLCAPFWTAAPDGAVSRP